MAKLSLWADFTHLSSIRSFVEEAGNELAVPERALYELQLAVDEACTNIIEHGYHEQAGPIEVEIEGIDGGVRVVVRDWGQAFDPGAIPRPDINAPLESRAIGGVGLFLMRQVMDQVEFKFDAQQGNTVTMTKYLPEK